MTDSEPEIEIPEELLKELRRMGTDLGGSKLWDDYCYCLPTDPKGRYRVRAEQDGPDLHVSAREITNYPWLFINTIRIDPDDVEIDPEDKTVVCDYQGVNEKGLALVVIQVEEGQVEESLKARTPNLLCRSGAVVHLIYRLKNFLPRNARREAMWTFATSVLELEEAVGGEYVHGKPILNPWCAEVDTTVIKEEFVDFQYLRSGPPPSPEDLEELERWRLEEERKNAARRAEGKRKQAEAGRATAMKRSEGTIDRICRIIGEFHMAGRPVTQLGVAKAAGIDRKTVYRHWKDERIQGLLR